MKTVAVSGANGYLGSTLVAAFSAAGWNVVRLVRTPNETDDRCFRLGEEIAPSVLDGIDLLVHSAYDMRVVAWREILHINVDGSAKLLRAASDARVPRAIVLSSMSAYSGTEQLYGRAKLDIEEIARGHGAISVRPGLVVGRKPGGMAGTLARLVALPITPTLRGLGRQFTLDQDDFVSAILLLAETEHPPTEPVGLAHPLSIEFDGLLRGIATMVGVRSPKLIPVPWRLVDFTLRACEISARSPTTAIRFVAWTFASRTVGPTG